MIYDISHLSLTGACFLQTIDTFLAHVPDVAFRPLPKPAKISNSSSAHIRFYPPGSGLTNIHLQCSFNFQHIFSEFREVGFIHRPVHSSRMNSRRNLV